MTAESTAAAPEALPRARVDRGRQPPRWAVITVVLVLAVLVTDLFAQALWPLLRADDWPYLLPAHTPGTIDNWAKNLREGRWLNYLWWLAIGQHTTTTWASVTHVTAYVLFVAGLWRLLWRDDRRTHWAVQVLVGLALFASVTWVQLLYWPATQVSSALVAAAGVWTLPLAARRRGRFGAWLLVVTVLSVLSYPPVAAVLFVAAVVHLGRMPWRRLLLLTLGWVGSFALGVGVIYTLNWFAFGHFGLEIAAWRHPNPLHDLASLRTNVRRAASSAAGLLRLSPVATVAGVLAVVAGLLSPVVRPLMTRLLVALAVVAGLEAAQTVVTGVATAPRGELWIWLALVLPAVLLLRDPGVWSRVGMGMLAVLAVVGLVTWRTDVVGHQQTRQQYDAIVAAATRPGPGGSRPEVVFYQDHEGRTHLPGQTMAGVLWMMVRQGQDRVPRWCRGAECTQIARAAAGSDGFVVRVGSVVGVVVPPPPDWVKG
ncbi:hypothetical protein [Terrabacter sp. NPDC080008]|uniref:hypothetical protein n=1 Tax=Terrabacter sp. NPDC080008 TaxID=3155176 RepID=UPI00344EF453